jgi:hypothetical protein
MATALSGKQRFNATPSDKRLRVAFQVTLAESRIEVKLALS